MFKAKPKLQAIRNQLNLRQDRTSPSLSIHKKKEDKIKGKENGLPTSLDDFYTDSDPVTAESSDVGIIVFRVINGEREYLLLKEKDWFRNWAMPKGRKHELGMIETELEMAERKTREYTGFDSNDFSTILDFKTFVQYGKDRKHKRATCFAAKVHDPYVKIHLKDDGDGHSEYRWRKVRYLKFNCTQRILNAFLDLDQSLKDY